MLIREQIPLAGFVQHGIEERRRHVMLHEPLAVLGKGRGVEGRVSDVEVEEPLEQQVVLQPLTELPLAADRYKAISRLALSKCSGGMEGRPLAAYIWAKVGASAASACSTIGLMRRIGCSAGTNWSGVRPISIVLWWSARPRIGHLLHSLA